MFIINRIINSVTKRSYYPDIILKHHLPESSIESFPSPVVKDESPYLSSDLVDMEAAGFMEAAMMFFPSHNIYCLKIVSDHLEGERITPGHVSGLIEQNLDSIHQLIGNAASLSIAPDEILTDEDMDLIEKISQNLNLTVTLKHQFKNLAVHYKLRSKNDLNPLKSFLDIHTNIKEERKKCFESIKKLLTSG
jgi:hypothetical protein